MKIIVLSSALKPWHKKRIEEAAMSAGAEVFFAADEDDIPQEFENAEVLYGCGKKYIRKNKNLKWICTSWAGVDDLLKPGVFANEDCLITNSAGSYGVSISEHIIAVSLMMMRRLTEFHAETLRGEWGSHRSQRSLYGSRITVLGTGDIGCCFARRAKAFEPARLTGVCRSGICTEPAFDEILPVDRIDESLPATDLLVMCLPETKETQGILCRKRLELLPEEAYIVNVGRGSAIDEEALAGFLNEGRLSGAALDVFRTEPIPGDSPLWRTRNLLITPHVAGNMTLEHTVDRNVEMFCEDLLNYAKGLPLKHIVDKTRGY